MCILQYLHSGTGLALIHLDRAPRREPQPVWTALGHNLGPTMHNCFKTVFDVSRVIFLGAIALALFVLPARGDTYLSGTYNCTKIEVAGKAKPCSAPSLELNLDGSYQILSERGTYEILAGHWLVLSTSKNHGKARLDGSKWIIFEFISGGKKSKITYRRKYQRAPGWVSS